jgi:hypothetical protein
MELTWIAAQAYFQQAYDIIAPSGGERPNECGMATGLSSVELYRAVKQLEVAD